MAKKIMKLSEVVKAAASAQIPFDSVLDSHTGLAKSDSNELRTCPTCSAKFCHASETYCMFHRGS